MPPYILGTTGLMDTYLCDKRPKLSEKTHTLFTGQGENMLVLKEALSLVAL